MNVNKALLKLSCKGQGVVKIYSFVQEDSCKGPSEHVQSAFPHSLFHISGIINTEISI